MKFILTSVLAISTLFSIAQNTPVKQGSTYSYKFSKNDGGLSSSKVFTDSILHDGIFKTEQEYLDNAPSLTFENFKYKYSESSVLKVYDDTKKKYIKCQIPYFALRQDGNLYFNNKKNSYEKVKREGRYLAYHFTVVSGGGWYGAGGVNGGGMYYSGGGESESVYIYDCLTNMKFSLNTKANFLHFLRNYPFLSNQFNSMSKRDRDKHTMKIYYVGIVNDIVFKRIEPHIKKKLVYKKIKVDTIGMIERVKSNVLPSNGVFVTSIDFYNDKPVYVDDFRIDNFNNNKVVELSIYDKEAKEYRLKCNNYFGFFDGKDMYLNPNYSEELIPGGKKYYKTSPPTDLIFFVTKFSRYDGDSGSSVYYDIRNKNFLKIISQDDVRTLLSEDKNLLTEYNSLKGKERKDIEKQKQFVKRLSDKLSN